MPTHYLMVYENALPFGQQFISTRRQIIFKTYFTCQFGMTFLFIKYAWTSHVPKIC